MVDLPAPEGALKMMQFPLHHRTFKNLLLDPFQFVFHLHHQLLELGL
jgi:hypothetical protein